MNLVINFRHFLAYFLTNFARPRAQLRIVNDKNVYYRLLFVQLLSDESSRVGNIERIAIITVMVDTSV